MFVVGLLALKHVKLLNVVRVECLFNTGACTFYKVDMTLLERLGVEYTVLVGRYSGIIYSLYAMWVLSSLPQNARAKMLQVPFKLNMRLMP